MSFISVLFALLLEQARPLGRGNPIHAAMRSWVRFCSRNLDAGKPLHGWMAWGLAVGGPSAMALYGMMLRRGLAPVRARKAITSSASA